MTYHLNYKRRINDVLGRRSQAVNGRKFIVTEQTYDLERDVTRLTFEEIPENEQ